MFQHTITAVKGEEARKAFYNDNGFSILYRLLTGGVSHSSIWLHNHAVLIRLFQLPLLKDLNMSLETQLEEGIASFDKVLAFCSTSKECRTVRR